MQKSSLPSSLYSMKIKEQTRKLAAGCTWVRQGYMTWFERFSKSVSLYFFSARRADKIVYGYHPHHLVYLVKKIVWFPLEANVFKVSKYWLVKRMDIICSSVIPTLASLSSDRLCQSIHNRLTLLGNPHHEGGLFSFGFSCSWILILSASLILALQPVYVALHWFHSWIA